MAAYVNFKGIIAVIIVIAIAVVGFNYVAGETKDIEIVYDDDSISVFKGDCGKVVGYEHITSIEYDAESILVADLWDREDSSFGDTFAFLDDVEEITGCHVYTFGSNSNDSFGGHKAECAVKWVDCNGSNAMLVYGDDCSLIMIKTDIGRHLFFNAGSPEDTKALYEVLCERIGTSE